ncbi:hypothetical protein U1Q18_017194 [Sarracenia purpurea var. burkii]
MSVDGETSRVMRGVQHGACDYLLKPIRMKELRNIWQHVFRKRIHEVRDIESHEGIEEIQMMRHGWDQSDDWQSLSGGDLNSGKKRKDFENQNGDKDFFGDPSSSVKKARVVWTVDLHQKFVKAVHQIGFDKVGPKKILDLMNEPWMTRENVASHLQKYRLYLSRLPKENDLKGSFGGIRQSDSSSKDPAGSVGAQNSINMQPNDAASGIYGISSGDKTLVQNINPKSCGGDPKGIVSVPMKEPKKPLTQDIPNPSKASGSRMGHNHSLGLDSSIPKQSFSWCEVPEIQFKEHKKTYLQLKNGFNHLPLPSLQVDSVQSAPSVSPRLFNREREKPAYPEIKPSFTKFSSSQKIREVIPMGSATNTLPVQSESHITSFHASQPILGSTLSIKNHGLNQILVNHGLNQIFVDDLESAQKNLILESCSGFTSSDGDFLTCLLQGDTHTTNGELQNKESFNHNCPELFAETQAFLNDAQRFDYEFPWESIECPMIDQGLFIV